MKKQIKVKWDDLEIAFERNSPELHSFIDADLGHILSYVDRQPVDEHTQKQIQSNPERYIRIEPASSQEQYRWMERYVTTVQNPLLREQLLISIDGKGAFRRFKDVLLSFPAEREQWYSFRAKFLRRLILDWLTQKDLVTDSPPPWDLETIEPNPLDNRESSAPKNETEKRTMPESDVDSQLADEPLRLQVKLLVDRLPGHQLQMAYLFLEFLRKH